jgi:hypothetical protein
MIDRPDHRLQREADFSFEAAAPRVFHALARELNLGDRPPVLIVEPDETGKKWSISASESFVTADWNSQDIRKHEAGTFSPETVTRGLQMKLVIRGVMIGLDLPALSPRARDLGGTPPITFGSPRDLGSVRYEGAH